MCLWIAVAVYRRGSLITDFDNVFGFYRIRILLHILQTVFSLTIYRRRYVRFCLERTRTINGYVVGSTCRFDIVSSIFVRSIVEWQAFNGILYLRERCHCFSYLCPSMAFVPDVFTVYTFCSSGYNTRRWGTKIMLHIITHRTPGHMHCPVAFQVDVTGAVTRYICVQCEKMPSVLGLWGFFCYPTLKKKIK